MEKMKETASYRLVELLSCDSTNDFIKKEKQQISSDHPLIVTSKEQLRGRGRDNRKWFSPRGTGLYISIGLSLEPRVKINLLSLIGGLAIAETLRALSCREFKLKWPNDVLFEKRKIAGVLIENIYNADKMVSITGMGVNVNQIEDDFPRELREKATSLRMITGRSIHIDRVTSTLISAFFKWIDILKRNDASRIVFTARQLSACSPGDPVCFHLNDNIFRGIFREISSDGGIVIEKKNGRRETFYSGEIER